MPCYSNCSRCHRFSDCSLVVDTLRYSHSNQGRKEGNVLFNDTLNTFYLQLYGIRHMVKDHSDSERKPAAATWATPFYQQQGFFYMHHPTDRITHTTAFDTPVVEHWLEQEIAQWVVRKAMVCTLLSYTI